MTTITCSKCGIEFSVPDAWQRARKRDHETFYCPNGHARCYPGESEEQRLTRQLKYARADLANARTDRDHFHSQVTAYKGHLTRAKRKQEAE